MAIVSVNYGMNQEYHVAETAFQQATIKSVSKFKEVKLQKVEVKVNHSEKNVVLILSLSTTNQLLEFSDILPKLQKSIEEKSVNLIGIKPQNININLEVIK